MSYSVLHVVHLLAAIFFIGTLFFEVMILGRIRQQIGEQTMPLVERAVGARSRVVLHWVVLFVYGAGIGGLVSPPGAGQSVRQQLRHN